MVLNQTLEPGEGGLLDPAHVIGRTFGGVYEVKGYLGGGGFSWVYEAWDTKLDSPVAVKILKGGEHFSDDDFRREAKLQRAFKHPNVVDVYAYGIDDGVGWLAMEYCPGRTLEEVLESAQSRNEPVADQTVRLFVEEMSKALEYAHDENLVHRDLKPHNILFVREGQPGEHFKLMDFGISSKIDAATDKTIRNVRADGAGTPEYMSPEQLQAQPGDDSVTAKSDIYSFGVILYRLLAGRVPHPVSDSSPLAMANCLRGIVETPPETVSKVAARRIPPGVESLVMQCLQKDPAARPSSMREVRERFLAAFAPPPPPPPRWQKAFLALMMCAVVWLIFWPFPRSERVWLPQGFEPAEDAEIVDVHGTRYYSRLVRKIGDQPVVFNLIPEHPHLTNSGLRTFYIMQDKVWVGLWESAEFHRHATEQPWRQDSAGNSVTDPRWPVMNVTFDEAHRFARWLAEPHVTNEDERSLGTIPSLDQWDRAAGSLESLAGLLNDPAYHTGPFRHLDADVPVNELEIAVGRSRPAAVGTMKDDCSIHGCRDMAGNGFELTRTGEHDFMRADAPFKNPIPNEDVIFYRGQSFSTQSPLRFPFEKQPSPRFYENRYPDMGFRVVLEPWRLAEAAPETE